MSFAITVDKVYDPTWDCDLNHKGITSPRTNKLSYDEIINHPERQAFKMYDDDGNLYYQGFFVDDDPNWDEFQPLECFGYPNAGATTIKYKNKTTGKWEIL